MGGPHRPEGGECIVQQLLVELGGQVPDEEVGPHVPAPAAIAALPVGGHIHAQCLPVQLDHVQDAASVGRILLPPKLDEAEALVGP